MEQFLCPHCKSMFSVQHKPADRILHCPNCDGTVFLQNEELTPGESLGGFEIIRILGKGGMGNVYLARQSSMQRLVALKVLDKANLDERADNVIEMFNKEIQLSGKLNHPNIIKAINAGETDKYFYMAITFVDGEDFEKVLDRGEVIPEKEAFSVALRISDALNYAWERHGLLHKDIKPGNIMKDKKGEIFLMDMGIAQHFSLGSTQKTQEVLGSPFYMSPEQAQGLPLDWRTDMYSLGATLYHMAVGVPPYDSKEVTRIIEKHVTEPFPEPSERNPNISLNKNTVAILRKMMSKEKEGRFASWKDFDAAVNRALFQPPTSASSVKSQTRKTMPALHAFSRGKAVKSDPLDLMALVINSVILIFVACIIAYFINDYRKNSNAKSNLDTAERYLKQYQQSYDEAIRLFAIARESARDTSAYPSISRRYDEVYATGTAFNARIKEFDDTWMKAYSLYVAHKYQQAIDLMEQIKDSEDQKRKNDALKFISQIKDEMANTKGANRTKGD